jgi:uncharacterized protein YcsI (UPF0317 family)
VLDVSDPGDPTTRLARGADLRTDLPQYRIWQDGELVAEVADAITHAPGYMFITDRRDSDYRL